MDDKTFLGKPADKSTGLTHIGAREYDPEIGQFISVDPVLTANSPQSLNGYSYANNNPVTTSDPTGECADIDCPTRNCPSCLNATPGDSDSPALHDFPGSGSTPTNTGGSGGAGSGNTTTSASGNGNAGVVIPYAAVVVAISAIKLPWPHKPWTKAVAESVGRYAYMTALAKLRDWFGDESIRYQRVNIVLAGVVVDAGKKGFVPRTIAVLNASASPKTVGEIKELLADLNVIIYQAKGKRSDGKTSHSEQGVRALAEDAGLQKQTLGGKVVKWQSAYSTNTICPRNGNQCSRDLASATGRKWETLNGANGFVDGVIISKVFKGYMKPFASKGVPNAHRAIVLTVRGMLLINSVRYPPAGDRGDVEWGILDDEINKP